MIRILCVLFTLGFVGCGSDRTDWGPYDVYRDEFVSYAIRNNIKLLVDPAYISFEITSTITSGGDSVGDCVSTQTPGSKMNQIQVLDSYWSTIDDPTKEALVLHELGHCSLLRSHYYVMLPSDNGPMPASIMNPAVVSPVFYTPNRIYYWKELFSVEGI